MKRSALLLLAMACGAGPELGRPCPDGRCAAGLTCLEPSAFGKPVCLIEITDPSQWEPNGDPICPAGTGGFQTISGTLGSPVQEHHAVCAALCENDGDCDYDQKCLLITTRDEAGGAERGTCLPF